MYFNSLSTQLAVVSACCIFLVPREVFAQQTGCASFFQFPAISTSKPQDVKTGTGAGGSVQPDSIAAKTAVLTRGRKTQNRTRRAVEPRAIISNDNLVFEPTKPTKAVAGGDGICGKYDTNTILGVCLWSGSDPTGSDPKRSGWLSGSAVQNCNREVEVFRASSPDKKFLAQLVDGCSFNDQAFKVGCENIFVTKKLLAAIDPEAKGEIKDLNWNFKDIGTIF